MGPIYGSANDELAMQSIEIIPDKLYFASVRRPDLVASSQSAHGNICFSVDHELLYQPFFADFGPLNMGQAYRFCSKLQSALKAAEGTPKRVVFYCGPEPNYRANAAVLMGMFLVLVMGWTADDAYRPLAALKPFKPFRDASCGTCTFNLMPLDVLRAVHKARDVGLIDWHLPGSTWDADDYEFYESVENGDMNWIVPGKFLAFSGPAATRAEYYGYRAPVPEDYTDYFRAHNIQAVVRLNKKVYDRRRFMDAGLRHYELYFPDGSCPTDPILKAFLEITESEPGAVAVHCKAGLGRTGVLIGCYLMKHYGFTAADAIAYIRVCRPGSVIGPQQHFLHDVQARLWKGGDLNKNGSPVPKAPRLSPQSESSPAAPATPGGASDRGASTHLSPEEGQDRTSPMKPLRSGTVPSVTAGGVRGPAGLGRPMAASVAGSGAAALLGSRGSSRGAPLYPGGPTAAAAAAGRGPGQLQSSGGASVYASAPMGFAGMGYVGMGSVGSRGSTRERDLSAVTLHTDTVDAAARRALLEAAPPRGHFSSTIHSLVSATGGGSVSVGATGGFDRPARQIHNVGAPAAPPTFLRPSQISAMVAAATSGLGGGLESRNHGLESVNRGLESMVPHPPVGAPPSPGAWGRSAVAAGSGASAVRRANSSAEPVPPSTPARYAPSPLRSRPGSSSLRAGEGSMSLSGIPTAPGPSSPGARGGSSPVIQRIVNAAGQPRKVVVPNGLESPAGGASQNGHSSPGYSPGGHTPTTAAGIDRRSSSPGRPPSVGGYGGGLGSSLYRSLAVNAAGRR